MRLIHGPGIEQSGWKNSLRSVWTIKVITTYGGLLVVEFRGSKIIELTSRPSVATTKAVDDVPVMMSLVLVGERLITIKFPAPQVVSTG